MDGCLLLLVVACMTNTLHYSSGSDALTSRCLQKRREKIYFRCSLDRLIYNPTVFLGGGNQTDCVHHDGDCVGQSIIMIKQVSKCHWRKSCSVEWRSGELITKAANPKCSGQIANYVAYSNPECIPKERIHSICDLGRGDLNTTEGVIRSHEDYPWSYTPKEEPCKKTVNVPKGFKLVLDIDDVDIQDDDNLYLYHMVDKRKTVLFNSTSSSMKRITVAHGLIEFYFHASFHYGKKYARGFIIRFKREPIKQTSNPIQESFAHGIPHVENGLAIIEECINSKAERVHLSCPMGQYVYKPNIVVGSSRNGQCHYSDGDCTGLIHTLLAQRNNCYWSTSCQLSWKHRVPITKTQDMNCFGLSPSYVTMKGFECVQSDSVFDICDKKNWEIDQATGIIRSHPSYPWNYLPSKVTCRKRLRVNKRLGLRLVTDDFDLDLDSHKERVNIWHVTAEGKRRRIRRLRGNQMTDISVEDGCLDVEFRTVENSKTGRGFILLFQLLWNNTEINSIQDEDEEIQDCGGKESFFPRRPKRRFSKSRREKNRNRMRRRKRNRQHKNITKGVSKRGRKRNRKEKSRPR